MLRTVFLCIISLSLSFAEEQLSVSFPAGSREVNGMSYIWDAQTLSIRAPKIRDYELKNAPVPGIGKKNADGSLNWANWPKKTAPYTIKPKDPQSDSLSLGPLYNTIIPESIEILKKDGSKAIRDTDFRVNEQWGHIVSIENRLGNAQSKGLTLRCQYRYQRLDLVQLNSDGKLSVKEGIERLHCPALPKADPDHIAVGSIYVAPFYPAQGKRYSLPKKHIFLIDPKPTVTPINPNALNNAKESLRSGKELKIAFVGDSITLGAEAGPWWDDRSKTYTGKFVAGLKERYAKANITEIASYKGGITAIKAYPIFQKQALPARPDLVLLALGVNDSAGDPPKGPKVPAAEFKEVMRKMVVESKAIGAEVMIITPFPSGNVSSSSRNIAGHVAVLKELAAEENVALADVYTQWLLLEHRGIPHYSQLHNWVNHPGDFGHEVYAEAILEFFKP